MMYNSRHRPPRLTQLFDDVQPLYFITFNTYRRNAILASPAIHACFVEFCVRGKLHGAAVGRYVIMPDHIHLFLRLAGATVPLSQWVKSLRSVLGKSLVASGREKPHWQEGFFDHVMRSSESYAEKWSYVRMNPVRAGLCQQADEWPYQGEITTLDFG